MSVINLRLPILRAERGLSQRQLAELTGLRPDTISALERGSSRGIQFDTLARLCDALACEPGDLFDLDREAHVVPLLGGPDEDEIILARLEDRARRHDAATVGRTTPINHGAAEADTAVEESGRLRVSGDERDAAQPRAARNGAVARG